MKKFLCILILALFCGSASAEWENIGQSDAETAYVDSAGIRKDRYDIARMWALFDLKQARPLGDLTYQSMKIEREYACRSRKSRIIAKAAYAGQMGQGDLIYKSNVRDKWVVVEPDSAEEALWNIACRKR
jgi:hypothetical protein